MRTMRTSCASSCALTETRKESYNRRERKKERPSEREKTGLAVAEQRCIARDTIQKLVIMVAVTRDQHGERFLEG